MHFTGKYPKIDEIVAEFYHRVNYYKYKANKSAPDYSQDTDILRKLVRKTRTAMDRIIVTNGKQTSVSGNA